MLDAGEIERPQANNDELAPPVMETTLREDEARRHVEPVLNEGVIVQDAAGDVVWLNSAARRLLGTTAQQLIGQATLDGEQELVHLDDTLLTRHEVPSNVALRTGLPVRDRIIGVRSRDGATVWLSTSAIPAVRAGTPITVTVFSDVTAELNGHRELDDTVRQIRESVFQTDLPDTDRLRVAGRNDTAGATPQFAGDFYGAYQLRPDRYGFFIGNVGGHRTHAACVGALARHTLRSGGTLLDDPDAVLQHLHDAVDAEWPATTMTVIFGYAELGEASAEFRLSCGGHALPILVREQGIAEVGVPGSIIGGPGPQSRPSASVVLRPGEHLLLHTSGHASEQKPEHNLLELFASLDASMPTDRLAETAHDLAARRDGKGLPGHSSILAISVA